jgi:hypothetical protein
MFRLFLFMAGVMVASVGVAEGVSPCPADAVPIQIMTPGYGGDGIKHSAAEISDDLPHFRAFVTDVTKHINSRLAKDKLCINTAESMKNMNSAERKERFLHQYVLDNAGSMESMENAEYMQRSLFQFVYWPLFMDRRYLVLVMTSVGGRSPPSCRISSPWIDLVIVRSPVPQIRGIIRWNERQLLADQAILAGAKNVPLGMIMPPTPSELGHFLGEYQRSEFRREPEPGAKPIEERVPPDILWLLRRSGRVEVVGPFGGDVLRSMRKATEKGAEGYTKLVITLIDRCFASDGKTGLHYSNILDVADPVLLKQYKIDTSLY